MILLNGAEITLHNKPKEKYLEKQKYEQAVSEYKKWLSLIKTVVGINVNAFSKK